MKKHFLWLNVALVLVAIAIFSYKYGVLKFPLTQDETAQVWVIEAEVHYNFPKNFPENKRKIRLNIPPRLQTNFLIENETFGTGGFGAYIAKKKSGHRELVWSIRNSGVDSSISEDSQIYVNDPILSPINNVLYYRVYVRPRYDLITQPADAIPPPPRPSQRPDLYASAQEIIKNERQKSVDDESFIWSIIRRVSVPNALDADLEIIQDRLNTKSDESVVAYLLREARYPTRIAHGIRLSESYMPKNNPLDFRKQFPIITWYEVWYDGQWHTFQPLLDEYVEDFAFALWFDDEKMLNVPGHGDESVVLSVKRIDERTVQALQNQNSTSGIKEVADNIFYKFSMFSLPVRVQNLYVTLLTIPLGAMLIIFFRNMIGIQTFGTFMPVLIAIAFRESSLILGILLFILVVALGVVARSYLAKFKLLLVPRLGAILIVVVLLMVFMSMLITRIGFLGGLGIALFPLVILTMTIERMSVVWDERGPYDALIQTLGSVVCATMVYLVITNRSVEHLIFVFPELLLICLSIALWMGRYSGYRLSEIIRFRSMVKDIGDVKSL